MLITNSTLITWEPENRILENHGLRILGDRITHVQPIADLIRSFPDEDRLDARGQYALPGGICAHTHFYGAFARGMAIPGSPPAAFPEILSRLWWPLDRSLDAESIRYSVLPCLVDAIRYGTTTLFDHHASPNAVDGSLDIIEDAVEEAGLRAVLCYEVTDRDGAQRMKAGITENLRFLKKQKSPRVAAMFGLHASLTLSAASLDACRKAAPSDTGFHIHAAEHAVDEDDSLAKSGLRVAERLNRHGILGSRSIAAHGVHFDAREIEVMRDTRAWLSHQPRSNMNNGVGVAAIESMLKAGVRVCLGNDGFSNAMWEEWKAAYLVHKASNLDPRCMGGDDLARIAIYNNGELANEFFPGQDIGRLRAGSAADIILVDYHPHTPLTAANAPWHIVFGFQPGMVTTTLVGGRLLMKDRQLLTLDEERIAARAREIAPRVWRRYEEHASA